MRSHLTSPLRRLALLVAVALAASVAVATPGRAAPLLSPTWHVSNTTTGAGGVAYSWSFTTATAATLSSVTFSVPTGTTTAIVNVQDVYGLPAGGTALLNETAGRTRYTLPAATHIAAGVKVFVKLGGFTNTLVAGSYTSTVRTFDNQATPAEVDSGTSAAVTMATSGATSHLSPRREVTFTSDTDSFVTVLDPSSASSADSTRTIAFDVSTTAGSGYTLSTRASALATPADVTLAAVSSGTASGVTPAAFPVNRWGFSVGAPGGDGGATRQGALADGKYVGYPGSDETIVQAGGPATTSIRMDVRMRVDYKQPAGTYSSLITHTLTAQY